MLSKAAEAEARAADLSGKLDRQREALRKMIGPNHAGSVDASIGTLEADEVRLEVDKAGLTARRDCTGRCRRASDGGRGQARPCEAIGRLTSAAKLDRLQALRKAGQASDAEVAAATAEYQAAVAQLNP